MASSLLYWTGSIALINNLLDIFTFSTHLSTLAGSEKKMIVTSICIFYFVLQYCLIVCETMVSQVAHIRGQAAGISSTDEEIAETASPTLAKW